MTFKIEYTTFTDVEKIGLLESSLREKFPSFRFCMFDKKLEVHFESEPDLPLKIEIENAVSEGNNLLEDNESYRIYDVVDPYMRNRPHNLIDFKRHLKKTAAVQKHVTLSNVFRPDYADYKIGNVNYARLKWTFTNFAGSTFMQNRKEEIAFYKKDGSLGPFFLKEDDTFDPTNPKHELILFEERKKTRQNIVTFIKGVAKKTLEAKYGTGPTAGKTTQEIYEIGGDFFTYLKDPITKYIEASSVAFRQALIDIDITLYPWLDQTVPGTPLKLQAYMIQTLAIE